MSNARMPVRNAIRKLLMENDISAYQFWKETQIGQKTAYRLCSDPESIPTKRIMNRILDSFGWKPGEYLITDTEWDRWIDSLPEKQKKEVLDIVAAAEKRMQDGRLKKNQGNASKLSTSAGNSIEAIAA